MSRGPTPYITPAGLARLRARIADARAAYLAVCATNEEAAGAGDSSVWHDNFAFEENQRKAHQLARRVRDLEELAAHVVVVDPARRAPDRVRVGCSVTVAFDDDSERDYFIAGFDDGDPDAGRLSYTAPLARALLGAEEGDVRAFEHDGRQREIEVLRIDAAPSAELDA